jgi:tryptophan halogenase
MKTKQSIETIGIIGGGVAGYLSALAFRKYFPEAKITLIESDRIPIIGVGEATTPPLVDFLHNILGFDLQEFYREVQPTHKLGIRFEWGFKAPYYFNYPFEPQDIYLAKEVNQDPTLSCLQSILMNQGKSFVYEQNGAFKTINSIFEKGNYAYHLDNKKFVDYLKKKAKERGVQQHIGTVRQVQLNQEKNKLSKLVLNKDKEVEFDLYIDCTGFSSLLLEKGLNTEFVDYSSSLFTNSALTAIIPNQATIPPYTSAITMNHGWLWHIPLRDSTHIGYVYSDSFATEKEVKKEILRKHPKAEHFRQLSFRSGRHQKAISGNVLAIGNAFGFVEPLESTGLHMIVSSLKAFVEIFKNQSFNTSNYKKYNDIITDKWDQLRWFLALHYKFNQQLDTPFWKTNRDKVNVSGYANLIELMKKNGPLRQAKHMKNDAIRKQIENSIIKFSGLDTFLVGQGQIPLQPNQTFVSYHYKEFTTKTKLWHAAASLALPHKETLVALENALIN